MEADPIKITLLVKYKIFQSVFYLLYVTTLIPKAQVKIDVLASQKICFLKIQSA